MDRYISDTSYINSIFNNNLIIKEVPVDNSAYVPRRTQSFNEAGKQLLRASFDGNLQEVKYLISQGGTQFISDWVSSTIPLPNPCRLKNTFR